MVIFMNKDTRICSICKNEIEIENEVDSYFVDKNNMCKHIGCFVQYKTNLKKGKWTQKQCEEYINDMRNICLNKSNSKSIRIQLTDWIFNTYGVSYLPKYFYLKLDQIYNGTYKGLSRSIPPEDLLDMWKRKIDFLRKVHIKNQTLGKSIDDMGRINYDLAILMSKYDSYNKWKAQQVQLENNNTTLNKKINYLLVNKTVDRSNEKESSLDTIIDEIF